MIKTVFMLATLALPHVAEAQNITPKPQQTLEEAFRNPGNKAKPIMIWQWMDGLVNEECISAELEAYREAGIGGVHADIYFIANQADSAIATAKVKASHASRLRREEIPLISPWTLSLEGKDLPLPALTSWHESPTPEVKYFSGTATYKTTVLARIWLTVGWVKFSYG